MKLDQLHYYDLYAPLVASVDLKYTPGEAQKLVLAAVEPLGTGLSGDDSACAFDSRWIDSLPERRARPPGPPTRTAAPTTCIPYMLIELQRPVQRTSARSPTSWATRCRATTRTRRNPIRSRTITIFVAEVASTFNEVAADRLHAQADQGGSPRGSRCWGTTSRTSRRTVFRQTQFAEFELRMHETRAEGRRDHRRRDSPSSTWTSRRSITATIRRPASSSTTIRARVELHSPLLPRLLRVSNTRRLFTAVVGPRQP